MSQSGAAATKAGRDAVDITVNLIAAAGEIIDEARNGRLFLLMDERLDEGHLVVPAQMATPEAVNFMANHARGLICLALTSQRVAELNLPMMPKRDGGRTGAAFTVSLEARDGVSTGISAADRARTIAVAIDASKDATHIVTPGHIFPVVASDGGILVHAGIAEAAVDVSRLAGLNPSSVFCAILDEQGAPARGSELRAFAQRHGLRIGTIRDLAVHRMGCDRNVGCAAEMTLRSAHGGEWTTKAYVSKADGAEHLVLQKGRIASGEPALVRMHPGSLLSDILCEEGRKAGQLQDAMDLIGKHGAGVIVIFRDTGPGSLTRHLHARAAREESASHDYSVGAQILADLGVRQLSLLSSEPGGRSAAELESYGLEIVGEEYLTQ